MSLDGVVHNFAAGIFVRFRPDAEAKFAASSQDAKCFRARFFRSREMEQPKIHQNTIETSVRERQLLRIAFEKINLREDPVRDCDHLVREIDAGRNRSELPGCGADGPS